METAGQHGRGIRWWPVAAILVLAAAGIAWQWLSEQATRQNRVLGTGGIVIGAALLLGVWLLFFSRLSLRARKWTVGVGLLLTVGLVASIEHRGYTGDMVPVFGWRFSSHVQPAAPTGEAAAAVEIEASARASIDFPQFFGPRRDGHVPGAKLARDWEAEPPRELWRQPVGAGWAGFAIAGADAITLEQRGEQEVVVCYDLGSGAERWVHAHAGGHEDPLGGVGPRSTPTLDGGRVFAMGGAGLLDVLDRRTGELLWERDTLADAGVVEDEDKPLYGMSGSPLVFGDKVIVTPGGTSGHSMVAYNVEDGALAWAGGDERVGYSSPMLAQLAGVPQILALNSGSLASHDPASGKLLWSTPWSDRQPNAAQPVVVSEDGVVISSGYGVGAARFEVARGEDGALEARELWKSRALKSKFAGFVHQDGVLYGLDDGILACVDADTGKRVWKGGRYGHGQLLLVEELLLVMAEDGDIVLVEATPEEHRELTRFSVLGDKTWNPPALAAPYLIVRNDLEAVCLELPLTEPVFPAGEFER